jgi:hypothetical protein
MISKDIPATPRLTNRDDWPLNRWLPVTAGAIVVLTVAVGLLLLQTRQPGTSWVEHRGSMLIVHGRGSDAELGYLAAGRYEVTIDQNQDGCADSLSLVGADGVEWFRLDPHLINYKEFARTTQLPAQRYVMHVDAYHEGNGLGPRATPSPVSRCAWVFELAPA